MRIVVETLIAGRWHEARYPNATRVRVERDGSVRVIGRVGRSQAFHPGQSPDITGVNHPVIHRVTIGPS